VSHREATARRRKRRSPLILTAIVVLMVACRGSEPLKVNTGPAPWPSPNRVDDRISAAGLDSAPTESTTVHYHSHLDIFVNGESEPVAASIGREGSSLFSPLHTHATTGMIHIEAPTDERITLGMLFTEWGVRLSSTCVGGYCRPGTPIKAYVDGAVDQEPMPSIVLKRGEEIALVIGSPPATVPSSWDCRPNIDPKLESPWQCKDFGQ